MASKALRVAVHGLLPIATFVAMGGCARPLPGQAVDPLSLGHEAQRGSPVQLTFEEALREAVLHSPELAALQLRIAAAGGWPLRSPSVWRSAATDDRPELGLELDVLSLFGLGPQRAEKVLARLRRSEAGLTLQARVREVAAEIAEAYAVDLALAESAPEFQLWTRRRSSRQAWRRRRPPRPRRPPLLPCTWTRRPVPPHALGPGCGSSDMLGSGPSRH